MQLRESKQKTKQLYHKTLQNLKFLFHESYQKLSLPKPAASFNPFSCGSKTMKDGKTNRYYIDFCNELQFDLEKAMPRNTNSTITVLKDPVKEEIKANESSMDTQKLDPPKTFEEQCIKPVKSENYALAEKMKKLEMLGVGDMEHVLDVEEAIHYYSRLKSPIYLDIVDKFFMEICTEFSVSQASKPRHE